MNQCQHSNREKAIKLAEEYKLLEKRIPLLSQAQIARIRTRVAEISTEMFELGYSLPELIKRRQKRDQINFRKKP